MVTILHSDGLGIYTGSTLPQLKHNSPAQAAIALSVFVASDETGFLAGPPAA